MALCGQASFPSVSVALGLRCSSPHTSLSLRPRCARWHSYCADRRSTRKCGRAAWATLGVARTVRAYRTRRQAIHGRDWPGIFDADGWERSSELLHKQQVTESQEFRGMQELLTHYDGILLDQYGVVHDGRELLPGAGECLSEIAASGVPIVIVSNSPCCRNEALSKLGSTLGLDCEKLFLGIVTGGSLCEEYLKEQIQLAARPLRCVHVSHEDHVKRGVRTPDELKSFGLELVVSLKEADFIFANGTEVLFKGTDHERLTDFEKAADWTVLGEVVDEAAAMNLPLLISNPDERIERADGSIVYCPGLLRKRYKEAGGTRVLEFGKPHKEVFEVAMKLLQGAGVPADKMVHIGDSLDTDVRGAQAAGVAVALVTSGIDRSELEKCGLTQACKQRGMPLPDATLERFNWKL